MIYKKPKNFFSKIYEIILISRIIALWIVLGIFNVYFKILTNGISLPLFFFLIWISGFFLNKTKAFFTNFIGHFLFDFCFYLHPVSFLLWFFSGFFAFLIVIFKKNKFFLFLIAIIFPYLYFGIFVLIAKITYITLPFWEGIIKYFLTNPFLTIIVLIVNPLTSLLVFYLCNYQHTFLNFINYGKYILTNGKNDYQ